MGYYSRMAELPALVVLGMWFVLQIFSGVASLGVGAAAGGGVAWWAHIGGFVAGMALGAILKAVRRAPPLPQRLRG